MKYLLLKENNPFATCNTIVSCAQERYCLLSGNWWNGCQEKSNSKFKIQPDDLLMIIVSAEDPEIAML
jgi:polysaccharide export outer membrane protein